MSTKIEAPEGVRVEITDPSMKKPDYDPMDVMREIMRVQQNIKDKDVQIRKQESRRAEFETWIKRHEKWRADGGEGKKPMYHEQSLRDGIMDINQNIRVIQESKNKEQQNISKLEKMLESYQRYQAYIEEQAAQAAQK